MANVINQIKLNNTMLSIASTAYAICGDTSGSETKIAYIEGTEANTGFTLDTGVTLHVYFTHSNTHPAPLLQVNQTKVVSSPSPIVTNAKPIKRYGATAPGTTPETSWNAGEIVTLTYDGQYWQMNKDFVNTGAILLKLAEVETLLQEYEGGSGGGGTTPDPDPTPDPEPEPTPDPEEPEDPGVCHINMYAGGSIVTKNFYDPTITVSPQNYQIKLYDGGDSIGHAYWDDSGSWATPKSTNPTSDPISTVGNVFYANHSRIYISLCDSTLGNSGLEGKRLTGIDLYFSGNNINPAGYTSRITMGAGDSLPYWDTILESGWVVQEGGGINNLNIIDNTLHLDFDYPFDYMDGNLGILIELDSTSYTGNHYICGQVNLYYEV